MPHLCFFIVISEAKFEIMRPVAPDGIGDRGAALKLECTADTDYAASGGQPASVASPGPHPWFVADSALEGAHP